MEEEDRSKDLRRRRPGRDGGVLEQGGRERRAGRHEEEEEEEEGEVFRVSAAVISSVCPKDSDFIRHFWLFFWLFGQLQWWWWC